MKLATELATEKFLKEIIIIGLSKLVKKTETDVDDQILKEAKKAWGKE